MNLDWRRRLFLGVMALMACWPLGHLLLVKNYLINPWELGGFAMYVQPNAPIEVDLYSSSGEVVPIHSLNNKAVGAFDRYRTRAAVLGLLASTDELAEALSKSGYTPHELEVELRRPSIGADGRWTHRSAKRKIVER